MSVAPARTSVRRTPRMEYERTIRAPDPRLRGAVAGAYQGYRELTDNAVIRPELPGAIVPMILSLEVPVATELPTARGPRRDAHMAFLAGMQDAWVITEWTGRLTCLQVDFTPIGAHVLFGVTMADVANRIVALEDVSAALGRDFVERLRDAPGWDVRFDLLDEAFCARLADAASPGRALTWAWRRLLETDGRVSIAGLAEDAGMSHRHFIARFHDGIGLGPKRCARILRFNRALRLIDSGAPFSWAGIAYDCGYNDQSHLIRDFHEFSGHTPTALAALRRDDPAAAPLED